MTTNGGKKNGAPGGNPGAGGAANGGSSGTTQDHGIETVGDFIAVGLADLGRPGGGILARLRDDTEGIRIDAERAGHLVRLFGLDISRAHRIELRRKRKLIAQRRKLIEKLFLVCEADLPPDETP